ncbi:hypothetical protein HID58_077904 [Brassica napus]|uniref:Knottin scorpion toxin-like domain-containing protein n=3 Tax=Brassica TaxID=3705 RepID=A0A0D3DEY0_BRAOL|nr:hypothetical protein Bca52824_092424 [Brassica carinata]KAH0849956.1 hypothetical protein HID58_095925 [Brassica napus]KAH0870882.1 hypothetical protein HID58_077904 [Brassica napus]CAF2024855.1 unnamed protein product [Brassica napus]
MIQSRYVFFAFLALSFLLADVEATELVSDGSIFSPNKGAASLCCNDHSVFGVCVDRNCNKWCRQGCASKRGGFCKKKLTNIVCHCYC